MALDDTVAIAAQNHADNGTFSWYAGWWLTALPLANSLDRRLSKVARSAGLHPSGTNFTLDLGKVRTLGIVALINHNLSTNAKYRVLFSNDNIAWRNDSGDLKVFPTTEEFGTLPWGVFNWGGILPPSSLEEMGYSISTFYIPPAPLLARYVRIYLIDPTNPTIASDPPGYLQFGRLFVGPLWRPSVPAMYPFGMDVSDDSQIDYSRGGETFVDDRPRRRIITLELAFIPEDEFMTQVIDFLDRQKGIGGDCIIIPKPTLTRHLHRQTIYCRQRRIGGNEETFFNQWRRRFEFEELL